METKRKTILITIGVITLLYVASLGVDLISQPSTLSYLAGLAILIPSSYFTGFGIYHLIQYLYTLVQTNNNQTKENENA
jgi:hypothetical protein